MDYEWEFGLVIILSWEKNIWFILWHRNISRDILSWKETSDLVLAFRWIIYNAHRIFIPFFILLHCSVCQESSLSFFKLAKFLNFLAFIELRPEPPYMTGGALNHAKNGICRTLFSCSLPTSYTYFPSFLLLFWSMFTFKTCQYPKEWKFVRMKVWNQYLIAPAVTKDVCYITFLHNRGNFLYNVSFLIRC